jgi:ribosomal protein S18 acetylase RimI-like enzyme
MASMVIRRATLDDAEALSALALRTFSDTFGPHTPPDDLAMYVADTYTPAVQRAEIGDSQREIFVVEAPDTEDGPALAGYAYLHSGVPPAAVTGAAPVLEIHRFYVDRPWHGTGLAHQLMERLLERATERDVRTIWLGVWEHNIRAQRFYAKYGFVRVGEHAFPVGTDPQVDWILARPL